MNEYFSLPSLPRVIVCINSSHLILSSPAGTVLDLGMKSLDDTSVPMKELDLSPNMGTCQIILASVAFRCFHLKNKQKGPLNLTPHHCNSVILPELSPFYLESFFPHCISSFSNVRIICHHVYPSGDLNIMVHQDHTRIHNPIQRKTEN